jgi:hypothetical protein
MAHMQRNDFAAAWRRASCVFSVAAVRSGLVSVSSAGSEAPSTVVLNPNTWTLMKAEFVSRWRAPVFRGARTGEPST